ncbi:hypothetical protein CCO03_15345 [Comamonas serinivorans]|uniref:Calcineurin-like phosphoesterase domain-containing protein n=1 Tax=Comamonas serinivorans TaxID=1082851 RepID=A0A1Y0EQD2_9BURK|nr:metallophosphoesterase [Comamonas serinivorans]ARU05867.1 hypothetical protein CCO03_15345 [Comamonas serinivorans]
MFAETLRHIPLNDTGGRDIAVGDIHGSFSQLRRALAMVHFSPEQGDRLFSVGDLVDRGPESDEVLNWLDKPWFHAVAGNHEFLALRRAMGDPYEVVDHLRNGGRWLDVFRDDERERLVQLLQALPLAIEVDTPLGLVGLVHAECPVTDWETLRSTPLRAQQLHTALWSVERMRKNRGDEVANVRAVIHGHVVVSSLRILGNCYYIDTGGWRPMGSFTLLDLHTLQPLIGPKGDPRVSAGFEV